MRSMILLALAALLAAPAAADARPRRGCHPVYAPACSACPSYPASPCQFAAYSPGCPTCPQAAPGVVVGGPCAGGQCRVGSAYSAELLPADPAPLALAAPAVSDGSDALDEVNAKRAARGLRPYLRDEGPTLAARDCAAYRARHLMFGHVTTGGGDFQFCRYGSMARATGCAAYPASYGFMACAVYENWTYAGAASVVGPDGRVYHSLFVR